MKVSLDRGKIKNLKISLDALSKLCTVNGDRVSWKSEFQQWTFILYGQIRFNPKLSDFQKEGLVWKTINICARKNDFSEKTFIRFLLEAAEEYISGPLKSFSILAQINYPIHFKAPRVLNTPLGRVYFEKSLNLKNKKAFDERKKTDREDYDFTFNRTILRCEIKARSQREALVEGHNVLELCLGLLHLMHGGYGVTIFSSGHSLPIGRLFLTSSTLVFERKPHKFGTWHVLSKFPKEDIARQQSPQINFSKTPVYMRSWRDALRRVDFSERAKNAIVLFQQGLAALEIENALTKFWTCMELMCAQEGSRTSFEKIIDRASSIFPDSSATWLRLNFIKEVRDQMIHLGDSDDHAILCAQHASSYAAELIRFALFNKPKLNNHRDILEYMSIGNSRETIETQMRVLRHRLSALDERAALNVAKP